MTGHSWASAILSLGMTGTLLAQGPARIGETRKPDSNDDRGRYGAATEDTRTDTRAPSDRSSRHSRTRGYGEARGQQINTAVLKPKVLEEELKLEWQQKQEIEQIFREYEAAIADLRREHKAGQDEREKQRLYEELKMARQARDTTRAKEVMSQLRQLRSSVSDEEQQYQEMLIEEIEKVLDEGQKVQFRRMLRPPAPGQAKAVGPLTDPEVLFMCLREVKLEDYQKSQLEQTKRSYADEAKRMGKDARPEEKKILGERILREVELVLNEDQKKELKRVHARMGGGSGEPVDLSDPRQLQYAISRLNVTKHRLSADQQTELRRIQGDYFRRLREMPRDDEMGRKQLSEQVNQQVMLVLTPEQQEAVKNTPAPSGRFIGSRRGRGIRSFNDDRGMGRSRRYDRSRRSTRSRSDEFETNGTSPRSQ